ncbi:hypothetical protein C0992_007812 [Termitomyces sp. T32_za158]|nr:hypothetical protein C0992_007812 [Termitomyces sp. T32_za158]
MHETFTSCTSLLNHYMITLSVKAILHPSSTILQRPELARYVRHVTEIGKFHSISATGRYTTASRTVHRDLLSDQGDITENTLKALALCVNLEAMTWVDDGPTTEFTFLPFLAVIRAHPLRELSIRTHSDLGTELKELRVLRLKGAPAHTIPTILSHLVHLHSLDTEYPGSCVSHPPGAVDTPPSNLPTLRQLTVRTSAMNRFGPQALWRWILGIIPKPGLETLDLLAFTIDSGFSEVPRIFILDLARIHGSTLKHFSIGEAQLTLGDIACVCAKFSQLETLVCATASLDIESVMESVAGAKNLETLSLQVQWIPSGRKDARQFTLGHARDLMLRAEDSKLREITIGPRIYKVSEPAKNSMTH